jgi:hypothetical protein
MIPVNFQAVEPEYSPEIVPDYKLYRYDKMSQRYYFEFVQGNAFAFISVTALASLLLPKGEGYMRWLMNLGDEAMYDREKKAAFGTAFHIEALRPLVEGGGYDFTELDHRIYDVVPTRYHDSIGEWVYPFKKSLASFFFFCRDRVKRVIAVEFPARSRKDKIACTIDLVAEIEWRRGTVLAIIDLKSMMYSMIETKKKDFFDVHEFQLEVNKRIWNELYGDKFPVTHVFNWAPVNFKKPTNPYTLQNQTNNQFVDCIEDYIAVAKKRKLVRPPTNVVDIVGRFENMKDFDISNHLINYKIV